MSSAFLGITSRFFFASLPPCVCFFFFFFGAPAHYSRQPAKNFLAVKIRIGDCAPASPGKRASIRLPRKKFIPASESARARVFGHFNWGARSQAKRSPDSPPRGDGRTYIGGGQGEGGHRCDAISGGRSRKIPGIGRRPPARLFLCFPIAVVASTLTRERGASAAAPSVCVLGGHVCAGSSSSGKTRLDVGGGYEKREVLCCETRFLRFAFISAPLYSRAACLPPSSTLSPSRVSFASSLGFFSGQLSR